MRWLSDEEKNFRIFNSTGKVMLLINYSNKQASGVHQRTRIALKTSQQNNSELEIDGKVASSNEY